MGHVATLLTLGYPPVPHAPRPPAGCPRVLNHVNVFGIGERPLAPRLGLPPQPVYGAAQREQQAAARWRVVWKKLT
jgi:hypothetical protein